jgi:hypothetical protein
MNIGKELAVKQCSKCKQVKPEAEYYKQANGSGGLHSQCKECICKAMRRRYQERDAYARYGLTAEEYQVWFETQEGKCAICGASQTTDHVLHIDHDHKLDIVRGLLCLNCNHLLGAAHDDVNVLRKAIKYLENPLNK